MTVELEEKSDVWELMMPQKPRVTLLFVPVFLSVFVNVCSADDLCPHWHQVKVMTERELLGYACEQFLGKSVVEIKSVILQTLEGHLRAILGRWLLMSLNFVCVSQHVHLFFSIFTNLATPMKTPIFCSLQMTKCSLCSVILNVDIFCTFVLVNICTS